LTALEDKIYCIRLVAVDREEEHVCPGDSFIDDTTTGVANDDMTMEPVPAEVKELTQSEEDLIGQMQIIIHFFLNLLRVIGSDLAPEKCVWFLICHIWKNRKARHLNVQDYHKGIKIISRSTGTVSGVKRKSLDEGHITLGFQISGYGKCTAQKKATKEKAISFGEAIKSSTMWRGEIGMVYNSFNMLSLDCKEIQRTIVNLILPKMGIMQSSPKAVVFGTAQFGGLGLTHILALQGHTILQYLLGHLRWRCDWAPHANATGIHSTRVRVSL
jgi:hypothetical protein